MSLFDGMAAVFVGAFGSTKTVTIFPSEGLSRDVEAIFRRRTKEDDIGEWGSVITVAYISAASADLSDIQEGDRISVGGEDFLAQAPMPDGRGMTRINLSLDE